MGESVRDEDEHRREPASQARTTSGKEARIEENEENEENEERPGSERSQHHLHTATKRQRQHKEWQELKIRLWGFQTLGAFHVK
jgi:hypothetical protein